MTLTEAVYQIEAFPTKRFENRLWEENPMPEGGK